MKSITQKYKCSISIKHCPNYKYFNWIVSDITHTDYSKQYMGCYNEGSQNFDKSYHFTIQKMSVGMCITVCKYYGYRYAAISNRYVNYIFKHKWRIGINKSFKTHFCYDIL